MNFFTARIRIKILFVKKINIHFSQRLRNSNTHLMSLKFKSKFLMGENHPFHWFRLVYGLYKIWQFSSHNQIQNIFFYFYHFGKSFWNVNCKDLSSFAQWTQKLPGIGCLWEERKLAWKFFKIFPKCCHASIDILYI